MRRLITVRPVVAALAAMVLAVAGCEEPGEQPAAAAAPAAPEPASGSGWGGYSTPGAPAAGAAKRSAQGLRDRIEGEQQQLADDIEHGRFPGDE
jgi:hypothetical protein